MQGVDYRATIIVIAMTAVIACSARMPVSASDRAGDKVLADTIMIDWVDSVVPRRADGGYEWTWRGPDDNGDYAFSLNRMGHLLILKDAYLRSGDTRYIQRIDADVRDWIRANPYPGEYNWTPQWRGLDVAARAGVWVEVWTALRDVSAFDDTTRTMMRESIVQHADYLRRFPEAGTNHRIGEMLGLARIAVTWADLAGATEWIDFATTQMLNALHEQVYPDGAHRELTCYYERLVAIAYEDFVRIIENSGAARATAVDSLRAGITSMWTYLAGTTRPDGTMPLNNDSDIRDIGDEVDARGIPRPQQSVFFSWAGQAVMRSGGETDAQWAFFDVGPLGTAHAHFDKLNLCVYAFGRDLLVDAGRYSYKDDKWQRYFVGSASHNVILVDGAAHLDVPFVSEPLRDAWGTTADFDWARGTSTGAVYQRTVVYLREQCWVVVDRVDTDARRHKLTALWHFHPDCTVALDGDDVVTTDAGVGNLRITPLGAVSWRPHVVAGQDDPPQGWYSPRINTKVPARVAVYDATFSDAATFGWLLLPARGSVPRADASMETGVDGSATVRVHTTDGTAWRITVPAQGAPDIERIQP